jgi:hypothetical protein
VILVPGSNSTALSSRSRFLAAVMGVGLLVLLALAALLRPDPRGWGTHEQLGLPPCTFLAWFGKRCPACGMTTSWAYFVHGQPLEALKTHASGTLLAVAATVGAALTLGVAIRGQKIVWRDSETALVAVSLTLVGLILLEWVLRLL